MDILPAAPRPEGDLANPPGPRWRRPTALIGLAAISVPGWDMGATAVRLMDEDPGFLFVVIPFVVMGLLAGSGIVLSVVAVAAFTILRGGRSVRAQALLTGIVAILVGVVMAPYGGVITTHGLLLIGGGGLVVVALVSPAAEREVGPLLGPRRPRSCVRPGVTPWWVTWRAGVQAGLTAVEWVAVVLMVVAWTGSVALLLMRHRVPSIGLLALAMALAVYVERGMRSRITPGSRP